MRTSSLRSAYIDQVFERGDLYRLFRIPAHSFSKNLRILRVITPIRACLHSPRSGSRFGQCVREKACRVSRYALLFPWKLIGFSCFFFSYGGKFRRIFYGIFFRIFNDILTFSQVSDLDVFKIEIGCDNLSAGRGGDSKIFKFNSSCREKNIYDVPGSCWEIIDLRGRTKKHGKHFSSLEWGTRLNSSPENIPITFTKTHKIGNEQFELSYKPTPSPLKTYKTLYLLEKSSTRVARRISKNRPINRTFVLTT